MSFIFILYDKRIHLAFFLPFFKNDTKNNIVYKIFCNNCNTSYVGQTKRQLKTRINEHEKNVRFDESKYSVITKHMMEKNHTFNWQNVKIMDYETNYYTYKNTR